MYCILCENFVEICEKQCNAFIKCVILDPNFHVDVVPDPDPAWHYNDANPQNIFLFLVTALPAYNALFLSSVSNVP